MRTPGAKQEECARQCTREAAVERARSGRREGGDAEWLLRRRPAERRGRPGPGKADTGLKTLLRGRGWLSAASAGTCGRARGQVADTARVAPRRR